MTVAVMAVVQMGATMVAVKAKAMEAVASAGVLPVQVMWEEVAMVAVEATVEAVVEAMVEMVGGMVAV